MPKATAANDKHDEGSTGERRASVVSSPQKLFKAQRDFAGGNAQKPMEQKEIANETVIPAMKDGDTNMEEELSPGLVAVEEKAIGQDDTSPNTDVLFQSGSIEGRICCSLAELEALGIIKILASCWRCTWVSRLRIPKHSPLLLYLSNGHNAWTIPVAVYT